MKTIAQHQALSPMQQFDENLKNSTAMEDRKQAVKWLSAKVGKSLAVGIAQSRGITASYFFNF